MFDGGKIYLFFYCKLVFDGCENFLLLALNFLWSTKMETAERAEILFNELDEDAGGEITEDDFIRSKNKQLN